MEHSFLMVVDGHEKDILDMAKKPAVISERNQKLQKIVGLLKFVLSLDDEEITKSTIESIIELLEEEINK